MEGRRLRIVLLEASLELVPPSLWGHPEVRRTARAFGISPSEVLLDKSLHYNAMARLPYKWKRGRPDILHVALLSILDSPLAESGLVEVLVHTIEGRVFRVSPRTRLPKHYDRFKGLMAQLLRVGRVPPEGDPLIWEVEGGLEDALTGPLLLLDEEGEPSDPASIVRTAWTLGGWIGIGVFPRGGFSPVVQRLASRRLSIYGGRPLKAWTVASRIMCAGELLSGYWGSIAGGNRLG